MGLETGDFIDDLVSTNPVGATDTKSEGDDHLRLIKHVLKSTFPNFTGAVTATHAVFNEVTSGLFTSTDPGGLVGPIIDLHRNSASPANSDRLGAIQFNGEDAISAKTEYANIHGVAIDVANGTEDGAIRFEVAIAGSITQRMQIDSTGIAVLGDVSASVQVQGGTGTQTTATSADQLFAKGAAVAGLLIETDGTGTGFITFGDGTLAGRISYDHFTNVMTFQTALTTSMLIDALGQMSVVGNVTSGGLFRGGDGAAATPGYSFTSDTNSGMYRIAENEIGIAVGGGLSFQVRTDGVTSMGALSAGGAIFGASTATISGHLRGERVISDSGVFSTTPAGTLTFRPNTQADTTNQMTYTTAGTLGIAANFNAGGAATITGFVTGDRFISGSGVYSTTPAGTLSFRPNGQADTSLQMTLSTAGNLAVQGGANISRSAVTPLVVNRDSDDGGLLIFQRAGATVASITVAAGVVTYGTFTGAHISQWQKGKSEKNVPRGTVMETVDQICYWKTTKEYEYGEILPRCKISDTEASPNVYGVFSNYDLEDNKGDVNIASLGTFVIRMQKGQKVKKGDLLESAGDGCAKVQDSDVMLAKTIAKVTSTTVIEEYQDGSFVVPCTLHCG